jgi:flagellar biosynthetic protein FliP
MNDHRDFEKYQTHTVEQAARLLSPSRQNAGKTPVQQMSSRVLLQAVVIVTISLLTITATSTATAAEPVAATSLEPASLFNMQSVASSLPWMIGAAVLSVVPAVLLMSTCFVRFAVVLGLLRQALGTPQVLPNQVLMALSLFLTAFVMTPVWTESYETGWKPYANLPNGAMPALEVVAPRILAPIRRFMSRQIESSGNSDGVWMLLDLQRQHAQQTNLPAPESYDDVPLTVLLPAFLLSELKTGFLIGFQLFLPFVVIDFVIVSVLTALGMTTMTPSTVALPFKLLLFVLIDGWFLTVGMLLTSVT